ncbi:MAG: glycoside hydrolase family 27 protein [Rikenellaceae bacterium]
MKKTKIYLLLFAAFLITISANAQKFEGLARTPQMGWNSWNKFACNINEQLIRETAGLMVEKGLLKAGYVYLNIDDCWHGGRDSLGFITENEEKFPSGMKALAGYIHGKGLKLGIYSDAGTKTCGGYPGSLGHEYQDAITYAKWGIDYLKYDWCNTENVNPQGAYRLMRDALYSAGRPVFFSMCEWGDNKPWLWAKDIGHSWRTTGDIWCCFDCIKDHGTWKSLGVLQILDLQEGLRQYAGPGHWNDPDMLQVGNGMSVNEDRAHFTMWCMLAAPLILGNDLTEMKQETLEIITNKDVIAIDQDTLGIQGFKHSADVGLEFWFKPLAGEEWAFCILNRTTADIDYTIGWNSFVLTDDLSGRSTAFDTTLYKIKNLWSGKEDGDTKHSITVTIPAHDVLLYKLAP